MITAENVRRVLQYDPDIGVFAWRGRSGDSVWNARWSGRQAGRVTPKGYRLIGIEGRYYRAHRLAWLYVHGQWPPEEIDHIDGNRDNNAIANLRPATRSQNAANKRKRPGSTSRFKGVHWHGQTGKWAAAFKLNGKAKHLGLFETEEDAARAYETHARKAHGEFARLDSRAEPSTLKVASNGLRELGGE